MKERVFMENKLNFKGHLVHIGKIEHVHIGPFPPEQWTYVSNFRVGDISLRYKVLDYR